MRYLITKPKQEPFFTAWFDLENHYEDGMVVYDLDKLIYTLDGRTWNEINVDSL